MIRKSFSKKARLRSALIKNLSLIILKRYTFIAINNYFITLKGKGNTYEISTDTSSFPKSLLLHCKQINRVENKVDGQQSSLLTYMQVSDYKAAFTPMHLVFLELDIHQHHFNQILSSLMKKQRYYSKKTISKAIKYLQSIYDNETSKFYPDLKPAAPQEPQVYCLRKLTEI